MHFLPTFRFYDYRLTKYHSLESWLAWMDELSDEDYLVIDRFLPDDLYALIRLFFFNKLDEFNQAGIGARHHFQIKQNIRGDQIYWLEPDRDGELEAFWQLLEETRYVLNRYCFLSLSGQEFHLTHYPPGGGYARHLDQFSDRNNRMISMVIYLNEDWRAGDGGELELVDSGGREHRVQPLAQRCILFKSAVVPHGVRQAGKDRYSITGWFLYQPGPLGVVLG